MNQKQENTEQCNIEDISDFFEPTYPKEGSEIKGKCVVCGRDTNQGNKIDFSSNFTSWSKIHAEGNCICPRCYTLCRDQIYRRKSWIATKQGIVFLKREDYIENIMNAPNEPFAMYITQSGKKQGFFEIIDKVNVSNQEYYMAFENNLIFVDISKVKRMVKICEEARALEFKKSELLGHIETYNYIHDELCKKIEKYKNNTLWELIVYASK